MADTEFRRKLLSLHLNPSKAGPKVTVDRHDHHVVEVTTSDDRQDVTAYLPPQRMGFGPNKEQT